MNDECISPEIFERLQEVLKDEPGGMRDLYHQYLTDGRVVLSQLREAIQQHDAPKLRDRAHYLKGSSMVVGAKKVIEYCTALELMGKNAGFEGAPELAGAADAALQQVEAELEERLRSAGTSAEGSAA